MYVSCQLVVILGNSIIVYNLSYVALCDNVDNMLFGAPSLVGGLVVAKFVVIKWLWLRVQIKT